MGSRSGLWKGEKKRNLINIVVDCQNLIISRKLVIKKYNSVLDNSRLGLTFK